MLMTSINSVLTPVVNPLVNYLRPKTKIDDTLSRLQQELRSKSQPDSESKDFIENSLFHELATQLSKDIGELNLTRNFLISPSKRETAKALAEKIIGLINSDICSLISEVDNPSQSRDCHDKSIEKDDQILAKFKTILGKIDALEELCGKWSVPSSMYWDSVLKNLFLMATMFIGLVFSISAGSFLGIAPFSIGVAWFLYELNHNYEASIFGRAGSLLNNIRTQFEKIEKDIDARQKRELHKNMSKLVKQFQQLVTT